MKCVINSFYFVTVTDQHPLMWMLVNPTYTTTIIPFLIIVGFVTKIDAASKLNVAA